MLAEAAINVAIGLVIAVTSSFVTVRLSLKRFYSEKWWERKAAAYSAILEELQLLRNAARREQEAYHPRDGGGMEIPDVTTEQVERAVAIGAFEISEEAIEILTTFTRKKRNAFDEEITSMWDIYNMIGDLYNATGETINAIRRCAMKDLKID